MPKAPHGTKRPADVPAIICECYTQAAYIHHDCAGFGKQEMLELIMAETYPGHDEIAEWGKQFAALHGLDYASALATSRKFNWGRRLQAYRTRADNLFRRARVYQGDPRPLANVMEAAQTADAILRSPPNRALDALQTLKRHVADTHAPLN